MKEHDDQYILCLLRFESLTVSADTQGERHDSAPTPLSPEQSIVVEVETESVVTTSTGWSLASISIMPPRSMD